MLDCTRRTVALIAAAALAVWVLPAAARADGDPASDVLASQSLYLPQDANVPPAQQAELAALIDDAGRAGYRIRVALIASPTDLGSDPELWRQPRTYARFLGQELALVYSGPLLVVMPNGYGLNNAAATTLTAGAPGEQLGTAALTAVERLAAAAGHPVTAPNAAAPASSNPADPLPWIVFALGALLIALTWTASLRARPLSRRARTG